MFLKTVLNKFTIILQPQACFVVGFKKHWKTKTIILIYRLYVSKMEILDAWLQVSKNDGVIMFRLGPFYKYNFPVNLTNIETIHNDFLFYNKTLLNGTIT